MADSVVITGCSTGFGRVTALRLARRGWQVFATVRSEADRASLFAEHRDTAGGGRLAVVVCDITRASEVREMAELVRTATGGLRGLVNNAGTAHAGPLEVLPLDAVRAQLEVNTVAHLGVTQALLPLLRAARGTIINVSSLGGQVASPVLGAYAMSKFALEAMSDTLRLELAPFGVKVVVVEPAGSPTAIWNTGMSRAEPLRGRAAELGYGPQMAAAERAALAAARRGFPPERFAVLVEHILSSRRPRARYALPGRARLMIGLHRLLPDAAWDWLVRRSLRL